MTTSPAPTVAVHEIMAFENGEMSSNEEILGLFSRLVASGMAWSLQGSYGRAAAGLIESGVLSSEGEILREVED